MPKHIKLLKKAKIITALATSLSISSVGISAGPCYNDTMSPGPALQDWANSASVAAGAVAAVAGAITAASGGTAAPISATVAAVAGVEAAYFQSVAQITSLFLNHALGNPKQIAIDWDKLSARETELSLGDGDVIGITKVEGDEVLLFEQSGTWWKGIVAFEKSDTNKWAEVACLQDNRKKMVIDMDPTIGEDHIVVLSKAKAYGVHTNMYAINNWTDAPTGFTYHINWKRD